MNEATLQQVQMTLRPFLPDDAKTILGWCKDRLAFRLWSADRYKDFPAQPEEMQKQYEGDNMYPLTAVVGDKIVGHILLGIQKITLGVFDNNPSAIHWSR